MLDSPLRLLIFPAQSSEIAEKEIPSKTDRKEESFQKLKCIFRKIISDGGIAVDFAR